MRSLIFIIIIITGCGIFNPEKYNPNPTPVVVEEECCDHKVDTIRLTNGVDTVIILDTLKN